MYSVCIEHCPECSAQEIHELIPPMKLSRLNGGELYYCVFMS
jgi:hypothetical protein